MADSDSPATPDLERKLATILSADVAAYSRLMAEDEELTLRTFRGHKEVFEKLVELHRGRVFNTAGDAILAEFGSAVEAVRCATEIQAALRTRNDQLPEDRQVRFRIGVNLGDVMVQGQDLLGDGVNVAARLQGAAEPGGVCIAGSVYDQIRNKLSLSFTPLGEMSYKNIPQPVRTFAIAEADGLGILPAPARQRRIGAGRLWAVAAIVLLLAAAGAGVWGYSDYRRSRAEAAHAAAVAAQKTAAEAAKAAQQRAADAEKRAAEEARQRAEADQQAADATQQKGSTARPIVSPRRTARGTRPRNSQPSRPRPGSHRLSLICRPARQPCPSPPPPVTRPESTGDPSASVRARPTRPAASGLRRSSGTRRSRVSGPAAFPARRYILRAMLPAPAMSRSTCTPSGPTGPASRSSIWSASCATGGSTPPAAFATAAASP